MSYPLCQLLGPAQWDTHPLQLHSVCNPLALLSQCTGDRLLETNSPTHPRVTPTYCLPYPVESKLHAILLYFQSERHINLQTLIHLAASLSEQQYEQVYDIKQNWQAAHTLYFLHLLPHVNSHPTNTESLLASCNLLSACPALQTLQGISRLLRSAGAHGLRSLPTPSSLT